MTIEERFLKYVSFDTQSDPFSSTVPSTSKQLKLAHELVDEMNDLGFSDVCLNEYGIIYGTLAGNDNTKETIGFIAHMDTSNDASGKDIKPQKIKNYQGEVITLNKAKDLYLDPKDYPILKTMIGHDLITTDGTTLLGGDDKAGISIIMEMAQSIHDHPDFKHGDIQVAFTCDEEIGRGVDYFDIERFGAKKAYTIDGGAIEEVAYENFNAYSIKVKVTGKSIHPGDAKNRMINSILVAQEFQSLLPVHLRPEATEGYEGFDHLLNIKGNCEETDMEYIVRNHDLSKAKKQISDFYDIKDFLNKKYGYSIIDLTVDEQYLNMKDIIVKDMSIVDQAFEALKQCDIEPVSLPIRGGTDGAMLTYKGLPCPNLGTGGFNYHGPYEFVSLTLMEKQVEVLLKIIENM